MHAEAVHHPVTPGNGAIAHDPDIPTIDTAQTAESIKTPAPIRTEHMLEKPISLVANTLLHELSPADAEALMLMMDFVDLKVWGDSLRGK